MACVNHADRESIAKCVTCGAELCLECSREIGGRYFCAAHAAAAQAPPVAAVGPSAPPVTPGAAPATPPGADDTSQENRGLLVLLYVLAAFPVVGLIVPAVVLAGEMKKSRTMRFHAWQGFFLAIAYCAVLVATFITARVVWHMPGIGFLLSWLLWKVVPTGWLVLCIVLGVNAYNGKDVSIPFITQLATDQANRAPG